MPKRGQQLDLMQKLLCACTLNGRVCRCWWFRLGLRCLFIKIKWKWTAKAVGLSWLPHHNTMLHLDALDHHKASMPLCQMHHTLQGISNFSLEFKLRSLQQPRALPSPLLQCWLQFDATPFQEISEGWVMRFDNNVHTSSAHIVHSICITTMIQQQLHHLDSTSRFTSTSHVQWSPATIVLAVGIDFGL